MPSPPSLALDDFFKLLRPTHVLGTSYTLSLAFFEALVFPRIDRSALRRCLLLADRHGFESALVEAAALRGVGRDYMAACVPCKGSFHPKVWLLVGEDEAAILTGSGNLTRSGFIDNAELFDAVHLKSGGPNRAVAEGLVTFLDGLCGQWSAAGDRDLLLLDALGETREALTRIAQNMPNEQDPRVRFLSNYPQPLVEQLAEVMGDGTLHVAAPYFGGSVAAVEELRSRLMPKKVKVYPAVHGEALDLPLKKLSATPGASAHRLALGDGRFAHLKLYGSEAPGGCWLFTTSANCTLAALTGDNVEAGLLRSVSKGTLRSYFAEADGGHLPVHQRPSDFATSAARWLPLCATDRGTYIELTASGGADLQPVSDVELTVSFAGERHTAKRSLLFSSGTGEHVSWDLFPNAPRRVDAPPLLSLRGLSQSGADVEGAAFVDQPLLLTSEPVHRSAWRATLALLDGEGHPDGADLACVFHLFGEVFETTIPPVPPASHGTGGSHAPEPDSEDRLAIWPPVTHATMPAGFRHGHSHPVQWFQRILSGLMGSRAVDPQLGGPGGPAPVSEDDSVEVDTAVTVSRAAVSLWECASVSFENLLDRLRSMEPTAKNARKVWPVSIAILLVTLATRRQLVQNVGGLVLPRSGELVDRFLGAAFGNRSLPGRRRVTDGDGRATDASVAAELNERFETAPSDDLADVLLLLFAFQRALGARFFLNGWLAFRELAPDHIGGAPPAGSETIFRRFLDEGPGGVTWDTVTACLSALPSVDWPEHPGYVKYELLAARAAGGPAETNSPPEHSGEEWAHTRRRMKSGRPWCHIVPDRFRPYCCVDCPIRYSNDRAKGALADFLPVTCRGCGVVLVPDRLLKEYEARHVRST